MRDPRISRAVGAFGVAALAIAAASILIDPAEAGAGPTTPKNPVLTIRRTTDALRSAIGRERLTSSISTILSDPDFVEGRGSSCLYVGVDGGMVFDEGGDRKVTPASTLKVITSAAALATIAPGTTFTTELRAAAPPVGGVLTGNLLMVGGGDPLLETADYTVSQEHDPDFATSADQLADQVVASGISRIEGSVVGDDRRYDAQRLIPTWKRGYLTSGEVGPLGALSLNDNFTARNGKNIRVGSTNPPVDAAAEFTAMLVARGVTVTGLPGSVAAGEKPSAQIAPVVIGSINSLPIERVAAEILTYSDNTGAELLLKEIGFQSNKTQGSTAAGLEAVRSYLASISSAPYAAVDGSGLDRSDTVTCQLLADVLRSEVPGSPLEVGLPVMGKSGTLKKRLRNDDASGRVRAKTGSLNGVSSLAGFADTKSNGRAVFAFVGNNLSSTAIGVRLGDLISQQLVRFPEVPDASRLGLQ